MRDEAAPRFSSVMIGEHSLLAECAATWLARGHRIDAMVSPTPELRAWSQSRGIGAVARVDELEALLAGRPFDYLFSIANLRIIPQRLLDLPLRLPVNFHDALLPRHAGVHATSWALLDSPDEHGVTWHVMTSGADEGDILLQRRVAVSPGDTAYSLNTKCFQAGMESFAELTDLLAADRATPVRQDMALRSYHGRHDVLPDGGALRWTCGGRQLHALVRATDFGRGANALGTAKILGDGEFIVVGESRIPGSRSGRPPGTVLAVGEAGLTVATADLDLTVGGLSTPGGVPVPPAALMHRWRLRPGLVLPVLAPAEIDALVAQTSAAKRHEAYWKRRLAGTRPLDLPYRGSAPRPAHGTGTASGRFDIEVPAPSGLASVGGTDGASALLAAVLLFLARTAGEQEADVGFRAAEVAAGALLAAAVPLRLPVAARGRFADLCAEVADAVAAVRRHGSTYLRDIWSRYPALGAADGRDVLPVVVGIGTVHAAERPSVPVLRTPAVPAATVLVDSDGLRCRWSLASDAVERAATEALRADLSGFLAALADAPDDVAAVPLLSGERGREVLEGWNDTRVDWPRLGCVHAMVAEQARRHPDVVAVVGDGETLTYRQVDARAERLAAVLNDAGVGPGSLVGVYLGRSADLVVGLLGVLKTGAAYVPLDPVYPPDRIRAMIDDAGVRLVLTEHGHHLPPDFEVTELDVREAQAASDTGAACPGDPTTLDSLAYVIYTSGSTGGPKGVRIGHRALTNFLRAMEREPGCTKTDRLLAVTTVCFDIAGLELFLPLITGGCVEIVPEREIGDGFALGARISRSRPTMMQATPATWRMLITAGWRGDPDLRVLCGGEALGADLATELASRVGELWNLYGPTETTVWSAAVRIHPGDSVTLGRPIANTRFYVMDREGRPLPPYVPGELYIGGDGVADGYHRRPELTADKFVPDTSSGAGRLYRTGDLVRYLSDGRLEYLSRIDDQVKVHGYRIELGEVEAALERHHGVRRAVAVVRDDGPLRVRRLIAYLVPSAPAMPTADDLRRHLARDLPGYMIPAVFVPIGEIPLTRNGKVDRKALPAPAHRAGAASGPAPAGGIETAVATVWRAVLGRDDIGVDDNFFEAGGNSLLLVEVVTRLSAVLAVPLTSVDMFRRPTVRSMADQLEALKNTEGAAAPVVVSGHRVDRSLLQRRRNRT